MGTVTAPVTSGTEPIILWSALYVTGQTSGAVDLGASASGTSAAPDTGATAALAGGDWCQTAFMVASTTIPAPTWANGFATEGQDVTCSFGHYYTLATAFAKVATPGGTADARLIPGYPPASQINWAGALEAFK